MARFEVQKAVPMASAVPVPVAMERDVAVRLRDAEALAHRLVLEKVELAARLDEQISASNELAAELNELRLAKEAVEETASQLLARSLYEEEFEETVM